MKTAGVREVKNRLSKYLRLVAEGETVLVTDRGEIIAQLAPPPLYPGAMPGSDREGLERLARTGRLRIARGRQLRPMVELPPPSAPVDLAEALRQSRTDRA